jgi:hypothetical protein
MTSPTHHAAQRQLLWRPRRANPASLPLAVTAPAPVQAPQTVPGPAGQPGENAGEPAGLTGPGPLSVNADFSSPTSPLPGAEHPYPAQVAIAEAIAAQAQPEPKVQCVNCKVFDFARNVPDIGRGPHCADVTACTRRWAENDARSRNETIPPLTPGWMVTEDGAIPRPPPSPQAALVAEPLAPLPPPLPADIATAAQEASTALLTVWSKGQTLTEDEGPSEGAHDEQDAAEAGTEPAPAEDEDAPQDAPEGGVQS